MVDDPPTQKLVRRLQAVLSWNARTWKRIRSWCSAAWTKIRPGSRALDGAGRGAALAALAVAVLLGSTLPPGFGAWLDRLAGGLFGAVVVSLIALGALLGARIILGLRSFFGKLGFAALVTLVVLAGMLGFPPPVALALGIGVFTLEGLLVGSLAVVAQGWASTSTSKRILLAVTIAVTLAGNAAAIAWLAGRGDDTGLSPPSDVANLQASAAAYGVEPLDAADPSQPGPYRVLRLTYGSPGGRRPEFGTDADLVTRPVDATALVKGSEGWRMKLRHWYWKFDFESFPLNGTVWYPDGEGPFAIVLVVHGNHDMDESSDPGYAYLGELFASRGILTVSVDENFFNGGFAGNLKTENDGRGWLLLEHLRLWRQWNADPAHRFYGKVDVDRVGLIGHSRGGEAAAIAAAFNRLAHYPDDATVDFDYGFGIRAVIAIAPSDGQYRPADQPTPLENTSYLVLQGAHDADVSSFAGARQYQRTRLTEPGAFKASFYSYRSNHGQFNTVWGDSDFSWPVSQVLNRAALLDGEEQRRLGKVLMSAFLEATLHGRSEYVALFRDPRRGAHWLPRDVYVARYQDATFRSVADFEEDVDVTTGSLEGTRLEGQALAVWREDDLAFRKRGTKRNQVAVLGWRLPSQTGAEAGGEVPAYSIDLPEGLASLWELGPQSLLVVSAADADEKPAEDDENDGEPAEDEHEDEDEDEDEDEIKDPLDFSIELVSQEGVAVRIPLSKFAQLSRPLRARITKLRRSDEKKWYGKDWEPALQTFELPLGAFAAADPGFDPAHLRRVRLVFDRSDEGVVLIDDVGFAEP